VASLVLTQHEPELDVVLIGKEPIANEVVLLTMSRLDGEPAPAWSPGAHIDLLLGGQLVRQYSLCGDPQDRSVLQVAVLRESEGKGGSSYVHDHLNEGDQLRVRGPRNHFELIEASQYLFIAGGIGITPVRTMVAAAEAKEAQWRLVYGGRSLQSMAFGDELRAAYGDRVTLHPNDTSGLLDLDSLLGVPRMDTAVYCCGPESLLLAVEEHCRRWPQGALHVERFAPKPDADSGPRKEFEVELAQTSLTLTVPADRSILEVVNDAGVSVLSSCLEGTCGTCETPVLEGTPDHRDSILTEEERAANDTMMICVSRSCGSRLVLDL
jgi:ferredoxin-NADP reductase